MHTHVWAPSEFFDVPDRTLSHIVQTHNLSLFIPMPNEEALQNIGMAEACEQKALKRLPSRPPK
jgi:hypothetical protein